MDNKELKIRNSTAEFLIFTSQNNEKSIDIMVVDENVWLTQDMIAILYNKGRSTVTEQIYFLKENWKKNQCVGNSDELCKYEKYRVIQDRNFESDFDRLLKEAKKD